MRVRKVNRYYCDFCKKAGCAANHMKKHEDRCTMNPNRHCGMCAMLRKEQPQLSDLIATIKKHCPDGYWNNPNFDDCNPYATIVKAVEEIRTITNCPACIHAALKQSGEYAPQDCFDFKEECKKAWAEFNENHREG